MSGPKIEETLEDLHEFHDATTGMWTSDWVLQVCVVFCGCVGGEGCVGGLCVLACLCGCVCARAVGGGRLCGAGPSDVPLLAQP